MKSLKPIVIGLLFILLGVQTKAQNVESIAIRPGPQDGYDAEVRTDMDFPIWHDDDFIANAWTVNLGAFIQRSLIKFDLSAIPSGSIILGARLSLFCNTTSGHQQLHAGNNSSYLLMITSDWDQYQTKWDDQPSTTLANSIILPQSQYKTQDYLNIDVTNQIDYFHKNPEKNYGFLMKLLEEETYSSLVFASSNHIDPSKRPLLEIEFISCVTPDPSFAFSLTGMPKEVSFTLIPENNTNYWWDFGDGFYSSLLEPVHTYQTQGKYNVCLTASNGCDTITTCDSVNVCSLVDAQFSFQNYQNSVSFVPMLNDPEAQYTWNFGDGFYSYLKEPVHQYNSDGAYLVCLTVSNNCNLLTFCDTVRSSALGIDAQSVEKQVNIFPSPTDGIINVTKGGNPVNFQSLKVIGMDGKLVFEHGDFTSLNSAAGVQFDLSGFANGIYTVLLLTDQGYLNQKVILCNKK
ncbi:MAG: DNRLRE domain-containing protein [Lentimicrobiaceae bacterium]|nr:DNRLRE domain-containing protein [Lentimicrobiaceae bacterium]